jgi:pyruvate-ferredoxin/flavodoxin oxidoreductase
LILAYSHCIAHGIDMRPGMKQQDLAVASGFWPLLRFNPVLRATGQNPFRLDSPRPAIPLEDYAYNEIRYSGLAQSDPAEARVLFNTAQREVAAKYREYEALSELDGVDFHSKVNSAPSKRLP